MIVNGCEFSRNFNFKADETEESQNSTDIVKSDLVSSPETDEFVSESNKKTKKKKHTFRNISLGIVSSIMLIYGGVVLKRKLSKPSFEEVQKCFREIFEKDLSSDEVKTLLKKYKEICKNDKTEDFTKQIIEQLKKDYGIAEVQTEVTVTKLKDNSLKTALSQTEKGNANPLGEINIMPSTHSDNIIRSVQGDTFSTSFHELKHLKQFSDAYRANPGKFAEVLANQQVGRLTKEEMVKAWYDTQKNYAKGIIAGDVELLAEISKTRDMSVQELQNYFSTKTVDDVVNLIKKHEGIQNEEDILKIYKEDAIAQYRQVLNSRYGKLERFKEGTPEYQKGMEYIEGYKNYPDASVDYDAYRANILEKEAWHIGDLAKKIYKYSSSIWKL